MSGYSSVLAVLSGSTADRGVLAAAAGIAGPRGRLDVLAVRSDPVRVVPVVGEAGAAAAAELVAAMELQAKERSARARASFDAWHSSSGAGAAEFREVVGHPAESPAAAARNSDILVMAAPREQDGPMAAELVETCLFGSGRPLLVVPPDFAAQRGASVAVLWDGSRTAARALGDAMPLLSEARSVLVLTAGPLDEELPSGEAVVARLQARGVTASARMLQPGANEGAALAAATAEAGCDLIVMGGYGHSRLREMILGGVTRYMLAKSAAPLLMAH
jgi:nucleotide-binding universal stress UspA family protein